MDIGPCPADQPSRFVAPSMARKYDFDIPEYNGVDHIAEVSNSSERL